MSGVRIVTDSTAYLPARWIDEFGIEVVSLLVSEAGAGTQREVDMDWPGFYARMDASPVLATSSQPPPAEFIEVFERAVGAGEDVAAILISSKLSGTYSGARSAADMVVARHPQARIEIVDSRTLAMPLAFVVRKAAAAARRGAGVDEVAAVARAASRCARWVVLPTGLENLLKGGRIGGAAALVGAALKITPVITVMDGSVELLMRVRTRKKALAEAVAFFEVETGRFGTDEVAVQDIEEPEEAEAVVAMLASCCEVRPDVYPVGPVVGVHVGPGVGIAYLTKEPIWPALPDESGEV